MFVVWITAALLVAPAVGSSEELEYKYYKYSELQKLFRSLEEKYPDLAKVSSIGKSVQGRDIIVLHVTNGVKESG